MATSDEQSFADAYLDAPRESDPAYTRARVCESCHRRVMYGRLTWDAVYDARSGVGHSPGCKALSLWAVLEANGATTWEEPPAGGGGGDPLTWATASVTFADTYTFAALTT